MKYVLIPGMLCDKRVWAPQIELLQQQGIQQADIVVADLSQDDHTSDMADHLLQRVKEPMHILAFSLGTLVTYQILKKAPESVLSLVLIATGGAKLRPELLASLKDAQIASDENFEQYQKQALAGYLAPGGVNYDETSRTITDMALSLGQAVSARQLNAVITSGVEPTVLEEVTCPTLIVGGGSDRRTIPQDQLKTKNMMPTASVEIIEGVEHFISLQAPQKLNQILSKWYIENHIWKHQ